VNDDDDGLALALDVGGTTIKAELVDRAGTVVASEQRPTPQGHLVTGHRGETAEIGHLAVRTGVRCACGRDACLEAIASAAAIARRYTGLSGSHVTGAHDVAARLSTDAVARQAWPDAVEALADGLAIVSLLAGPALVLIGGGLSRVGVIAAALLARDGWAPAS
jgi:glucokinase